MDFFATQAATKPIPTEFPDLFVRPDFDPGALREMRAEFEALGADASDEDMRPLVGFFFERILCDSKGEPFENTLDQIMEGLTPIQLHRVGAAVSEAVAKEGKPSKKAGRGK